MLEDIDLHEQTAVEPLPIDVGDKDGAEARESLRGGAKYLLRSIRAKWRERQTSPTSQDSLVGGLARVIEDLEDYESTERLVTRELSRHYLAVIIGCWAVLTAIQGLSLLCLYFWEFAPIVIGMVLSAICIVFYYSYVWKVLRVPFKRLWRFPYPYAMIATILGCLSQHTVYIVYRGFNVGHLVISFCLIEAFYIILVSSVYQNFMIKCQKMMAHRKLCYNAVIREQRRGMRIRHTEDKTEKKVGEDSLPVTGLKPEECISACTPHLITI